MSFPVLPNPSNFLGIVLVINRSREGPRFIFHYPPRVQNSGSTADNNEPHLYASGSTDQLRPHPDLHHETDRGVQVAPWEIVAGFPTKELANILTPARAYHKKLFQLSLDGLHFVSYPICVPENGIWRKKKKKKNKNKKNAVPPKAHRAESQDSPPLDTDDGSAVDTEDKKSSMTMFNLVFILKPKKHEVKGLVDIMFTHIVKKINKTYMFCQQQGDFVWKESKRILELKDKGREEKMKMSLMWDEILSSSSLAASMKDVYDAVSRNKIAALQLDTPEGTIAHSVQIPVPFHTPDLPYTPGGDDGDETRGLWLTTANSFVDDDGADDPAFLDKTFGLLLMDDEPRIMAELQSEPDDATASMMDFVRNCKPTLSFHQVAQQPTNVLTPAQMRRYTRHFIVWRRAMAVPPLHARDMYTVSPNCDMSRLPRAAAAWAREFPLAPPLPDFLAELSVAPRAYKTHCPSKAHRPLYMAMLAWLMRGGWVTQLCTFAYVVVWPEIVYEVEYALEAEDLAREKAAQARAAEPGTLESHSSDTTPDVTVDLSAQTSSSQAAFGLSSLTDPTVGSASATEDMSDDAPTTSAPVPSPTGLGHDGSDDNTHQKHDEASDRRTPTERAAEQARLARLASKQARELAERHTAHARKPPPEPTAHPSTNAAPHLAAMAPVVILDAKKATGRESLYLSAIERRLRARAANVPPAAGRGPRGGGPTTGAGGLPKNQNQPSLRTGTTAGSILGPGPKKDGGHDAADKEWDDRVATAWPLFWKYFGGRSALERIALQEDMKRKDVWNLLTSMSEYLLCVRTW